jgi:hypothetical protein
MTAKSGFNNWHEYGLGTFLCFHGLKFEKNELLAVRFGLPHQLHLAASGKRENR